jgi:hypothetical protein
VAQVLVPADHIPETEVELEAMDIIHVHREHIYVDMAEAVAPAVIVAQVGTLRLHVMAVYMEQLQVQVAVAVAVAEIILLDLFHGEAQVVAELTYLVKAPMVLPAQPDQPAEAEVLVALAVEAEELETDQMLLVIMGMRGVVALHRVLLRGLILAVTLIFVQYRRHVHDHPAVDRGVATWVYIRG